MLKDKTRALLRASKTRGQKRVHLCADTKEGKKLQRQLTKARKRIADKLPRFDGKRGIG